MADRRPRIDLNNVALRGRLRQPHSRSSRDYVNGTLSTHRSSVCAGQRISEVMVVTKSIASDAPSPKSFVFPSKVPDVAIVKPQPFAKPATPRQQHSKVLRRQQLAVPMPKQPATPATPYGSPKARYSKPQITLAAMAMLVFVVGIGVSMQTLFTNRATTAQVSALSHGNASTTDVTNSNAAPSTTKPSSKAVSQYYVAPDLARYLKVSKLGINARVLQVGIKANGELGTPTNVFDTAWYTGSAKPGQAGATLIDGHVSSWTTHGVFYGIKNLKAGENVQIVRGDGVTINYRVVKIQTYDADHVDMKAAINPVTAGKSGLNLITCTGRVKPGTSEFNQRVIVFAEKV